MQPSPALAPGRAALIAGAAALGVAATYGWLVRTPHGRRLDERASGRVRRPEPARRAASGGLGPYRAAPYGAVVTLVGAAGLAARGPVRTACASAALLGTVASAELLKHGLDRPLPPNIDPAVHRWAGNSFPSGHTAGVSGLAAMIAVLAPHRAREVAGLGALATAVVGAATVAARWHRPSDAVGALLLGIAWGAPALALAEAIDPA